MRTRVAIALSFFLMSASASADEYIVRLNRTHPAPTDAQVMALGGHVDFRVYDRLVITIPSAAIEGIRHLPGTKYVQRAIIGAQPTAMSAPARVEALHPVTTSGPPTWSSGNYAYDGVGNITSIGTDSFSYDQLSRLKTANVQGHAESYVYDPFGNMTSRTTDNVAWPLPIDSPSPTNRFTSPAATYDAAGSLTDYASQHYVYDPFGMMREKDYDYTGQDSYVYNAEDERIGIKSGDWWEWSFRDSSGKVIREFESYYLWPTMRWLWVEDYVYRDGLLLGGDRVAEEGGRRHFHLDHLGTPRLITGPHGEQISAHDYFPFGNEISFIGQETNNGSDRVEPMKYTSHERDFNSGTISQNTNYLDYMHARYHDPNNGRFLSVDSEVNEAAAIYDPQRWNRYTYALNNPFKYVDRDGKSAALVIPGVVITVTGIVFIHEWEMATNPSYRTAVTDIGFTLWTLMGKQTGRQRDTGLEALTDAQIEERYRAASGLDRLRYQRELKARQQRNKGKARGGGREPKKSPRGGSDGSGENKQEFGGNRLEGSFSDLFDFDMYRDEVGDRSAYRGNQPLGLGLRSLDDLIGYMNELDSFWELYDMQKY